MAGEYDDQLKWPFVGTFDIELLNWREDKRHHTRTVSIGARNGFVKCTGKVFGSALGFHDFISHSSLAYNPLRNVEYLQDDCLRFRVRLSW